MNFRGVLWLLICTLISSHIKPVKSLLTTFPSDVFASKGSTVVLPCYTNLSEPVLWQVEKVGDYGRDIWHDIYKGSPGYIQAAFIERFRVSVDSTYNQYNLTITNVQLEDAGTYRCVEYRGFDLLQNLSGFSNDTEHLSEFSNDAEHLSGFFNDTATAELAVIEEKLKCFDNIDYYSTGRTSVVSSERPSGGYHFFCSVRYRGYLTPTALWTLVWNNDDGINEYLQLYSQNVVTPIESGDTNLTTSLVLNAKSKIENSFVKCAVGLPKASMDSSESLANRMNDEVVWRSRTIKTPERILLTIGMDTGLTLLQKIYQISLDKPYTINVINSTPAYMGRESAACVVSNVLYVVGIGEAYNELWKWSASRDEWTRCANMPLGRRRHCVSSVDDKIYVFGGYLDADNRALDSILCYYINSNKWAEAGRLVHAVYTPPSVTYKHRVYVFGGIGAENINVNYVQVYDTSTGIVSLGSNPMPQAQRLMRAVLWGSKALLVGHINCYIYDFESNTWQERTRFKTGVVHFGLTLNDNKLYVSGGGIDSFNVWTCRADVTSLSVEDFISDNRTAQWKLHASVPTPSMIYAYNPVPLLK